MNNSNLDIGRPGQQLLPGYVVKLLKTLKIPFGTDRTMNGVDVDPTIAVISHVIDCLGALRDINKVYRAKGSLASRSVGTRAMFGFTAELGNILLDSITFEPPADLSDSSIYYGQVASSILTVFPEIAAQVTPATGKVLIHHTALKTSPTMAMESIKLVVKAFPAGAWTADRTGALPLHWVTHNPHCSQEMINFLINANPKGPWVADVGKLSSFFCPVFLSTCLFLSMHLAGLFLFPVFIFLLPRRVLAAPLGGQPRLPEHRRDRRPHRRQRLRQRQGL